jgi:PAS domain S-box-containing protein
VLRLADLGCLLAYHDQLGEVFFALDREWRIAACNEAGLGLTGRPQAEVVGRSYWEVAPHARGSALENAFSNALASRDRVEVEIESQMRPERHMRAIVLPLADGLAVSFRDVTEQHSAEVERQRLLAESEERLRLAADAAAIGTWDVDLPGRERRWSEQMKALLGLSPEVQPDPRLFSSLIDERDRDRVNDLFRRVYRGEDAGRYAAEFRIRRASDGAERWISKRGRVLFDGQGRAVRALGALIDVTERRGAEEALRDSEELFRNLAEALPQIVWVMRAADGVATFYNRRFRDYHGEEVGPEVGQRSSLIHPEDRAGALAIRDRAVAAGVPFQLDARLRRHDGAYRWHRMSCVPLRRDGAVHAFIGAATDIHDVRAAEEALRESEERLRNIADHVPNGLVYQAVREPGGTVRFIYISQGLERLHGLPVEAVLADPGLLDAQILPEHLAALQALRRETPDEASSITIELPMRVASGELRWFLRSSAPRRLGDGSVVWDGVELDITDRKRAEERQQLLIHELNHRVKNTLATVQSIAAQTFRAPQDVEEATRGFEARLIALARAHDVLTRENWESANLAEIVAQAVEPFAVAGVERFELSGPELRLRPKSALALAMALQELATNAAKYGALSNGRGRIEIRWEAEDGRMRLRWAERGGPPVARPIRRGFGTRLIERTLAQDLDGEVALSFETEGLVCAVAAPLD